jgi:3-oxoacyl-(acyl-carrier-protein) synthase
MLSLSNDDPKHASRPFDARRDGGILGEGAACVLLEELSHARRRGARLDAEVLGFATGGSGYGDPADADWSVPGGMAGAMRGALAASNCAARHLDYVGCHGVSDVKLDAWETTAMKMALGEDAYRVPMSSVKGNIGIPQNAGALLQLVAAVKAMDTGILAPTINYEYADPRCDLDYVPNQPRRNRITRALVFGHGFNGSDAAVVLGKVPAR